ncbi:MULTISPECIES: GntR family transcriptional regulator [unclassified Crossiella]|uniref:GntR family transcriptional regulator n=1 Tax=unclassified Crossiella TaxID=2620835 RepID=UPI001FFFFAA4|nr:MULTISPECIES: GntR family transcriptional regulator [unclassified Crossiella]MCK2238405.1 GntR family transcriptional regulator [Crossiella sp. S99.2]MCK2256445.1 GntR family transcriptional regulator [Crossiella sp. S99.1]
MLDLDPINRSDDRPPYRQIANILREQIKLGRLTAGEKLPSESELIEHFSVARMTVRQAIQELRSEGLVVAEHGKGVFVRSAPPVRRLAADRFARKHRDRGKSAFLVEAESAGYSPGVDQIRVTNETVSADIAARLGISPKDRVIVRSRRYLADGRPVEIATSYIPEHVAAGTSITEVNPGPGGIYARLEEAGHELAHVKEEVSARMPTPEERKVLEIATGVPVMTLVRTAYDQNEVAVEVCDTVKIAHAYVLEYDVPTS